MSYQEKTEVKMKISERTCIFLSIILAVVLVLVIAYPAFAEKPFDKHWHEHSDEPTVIVNETTQVTHTTTNVTSVLGSDEDVLNRSIASMAALSSIPSPTKNQRGFAAAFGAHSGEQAMALGYALNANDKSVKIGISKAESEKPVFGLGVLIGY